MNEQKKAAGFAVLCTAVYMLILWNLIPAVYGIIDDRSMMEIVSGQYLGNPDAHTIFMGYWYSLFLTALYTVCPKMDWYALGFMTLQAACMCLVLYRICRHKGRKGRAAHAAFLLLAFASFGMQAAVQLSFTTTAAVLGATAVFWYVSSEGQSLKDVGILSALLFLTSQVRYDIFCMTVPVCAVFWIFRTANTKRESRRYQYLMPAAALAVFAAAMLGNAAGYGSPEWQAYKEYDRSRTAVYDFPDYTFPTYEGAEAFYQSIGIETKSRARTLINYNYTADDRITPDFFREYIEAYQETFPSGQTPAGRAWQSVKDYLKGVRDNRFCTQHYLGLLLYLGLVIRHLGRRDWRSLGQAACVGGIQGAMWLYLLYTGRIPDRVIYSMNLMLLTTGAVLWMADLRADPLHDRIKRPAAACILLLLCFLAGGQTAEFREKNMALARSNDNIESLKEYCMEHPDNFYFNDVTSLAFTTYNVRLWREEPYVMNYMSLGDWMSFSPVWQEKLEMEGITSVKEALYGQDNVYLICSFDKGLEYLISLYPDVECIETEHIPGFDIYSLEEKE